MIDRCATPSSCRASRYTRRASGSPQPGHIWCSWVSNRSGLRSATFLAWSGAALVSSAGPTGSVDMRGPPLPALVHGERGELGVGTTSVEGQDAVADDVGVEQRADAEAGAVGRDAADPDDRRAAEHAEADVVDHLPRA